jgi:hypothetical protein
MGILVSFFTARSKDIDGTGASYPSLSSVCPRRVEKPSQLQRIRLGGGEIAGHGAGAQASIKEQRRHRL